jgi:hypothetical protein
MYNQQLCGYKVEEKLNLGVLEQKKLNTTDSEDLNIRLHRRRNLRFQKPS